MKSIAYDCRDSAKQAWAGVTLRLFDDADRMVLQGQILGDNPQAVCERIAGGLGCELTWVGPAQSATVPAVGPDREEPGPPATLDPPAAYEVPAPVGGQLSLF